MLELRRLRLLRELHERGTIAAVADALQFTPSAVSQQLAMLEREAGVALLERAGRGVRLTDAAVVLVGHADALLDRAARAEADLAAAAGVVAGRARIAGFRSVLAHLALPATRELARSAPALRCELTEAEPETALPVLARGDLDLVLGDEWQHQPWRLPPGTAREDLLDDPVTLVLPVGHPAAQRSAADRRTSATGAPGAIAIRDLADAVWVAGPPGLGWDEVTHRTCRELGGFEPDIRHRTNDPTLALTLVAGGEAVTLLPALALIGAPAGTVALALGELRRTIFAATRDSDAARPSVLAVLDAVRRARDALPAGG